MKYERFRPRRVDEGGFYKLDEEGKKWRELDIVNGKFVTITPELERERELKRAGITDFVPWSRRR